MKPTLPNVIYKTALLLLCIVFLHIQAFSQHLTLGNEKTKIEVGLNFGPTFFLGDLGGNYGKGTPFLKDLNTELTEMMKGAFITFYPSDKVGFRLAGQYTLLTGDDKIIKTDGEHETYRKERNLDFKSETWEIYTAIELYPLMMFNKYDDYAPRLKPYIFGGVGIFNFDPMGSLSSSSGAKTWYRLQPLRTEGQGMAEYPDKKTYKLTQMNIPFGAGIKYDLIERITIGTEILYRKTFTDYIDDLSTTYIDPNYFDNYLSAQDANIARKIHDKSNSLSTPANRTAPGVQRGNSNYNDAYFSWVFKLGIKLGSNYSSENRNALRQTKCPHLY